MLTKAKRATIQRVHVSPMTSQCDEGTDPTPAASFDCSQEADEKRTALMKGHKPLAVAKSRRPNTASVVARLSVPRATYAESAAGATRRRLRARLGLDAKSRTLSA